MEIEGYGDDGLAILPRHTKVMVIGNNRTKSVFVGLHGVVKKAVGLGGWHWLLLTNGVEIKLQRNALTVIEIPTREDSNQLEDDGESGIKNFITEGSDAFSEEEKQQTNKGDHKNVPTYSIQSSLIDSDISEGRHKPQTIMTVNLRNLETDVLLRYSKRFNLTSVSLNASREQLLSAVENHFMSQELDEFKVISEFLQAAKRLKNSSPS